MAKITKGGVGCWGVGIDSYAEPWLSALTVYLVGAGFEITFRYLKLRALNRGKHWKVFRFLTPIFTCLAAILFVIEAVEMRQSLVVCKPWDWAQYLAYVIHIYFLFRLLMMWLYSHQTDLLATLVDVFLFTQSTLALVKNAHVFAFTFLTLLRFAYEEWYRWWQALPMWGQMLFRLILGCGVVSGALQVAEEVSMVYGLHPDTQG